MTQTEFLAECLSRTIDPEFALENEDIIQALKNRDDVAVITILNNNF